ncbi:uncharacterized protein LOC134234016 [Saccostrea cucullata]|uniref:uncharacterized protein LOC134234016 n=1 Tax=Saccostrea cuccullata TaxID=36930 RepID=UPI002ED362D5
MFYKGEGAYEKCICKQRQNDEEADAVIFQAAADVYGLDIYITNFNNCGETQIIRANADQAAWGWLHLRLVQDHYDLITDSSQEGAEKPNNAYNLAKLPLRARGNNRVWTNPSRVTRIPDNYAPEYTEYSV